MINLLYQTWINNVPISNSVPPHKRKINPNGYGNVKSYYLEKMLEVVGIEWRQLSVDNVNPDEIHIIIYNQNGLTWRSFMKMFSITLMIKY